MRPNAARTTGVPGYIRRTQPSSPRCHSLRSTSGESMQSSTRARTMPLLSNVTSCTTLGDSVGNWRTQSRGARLAAAGVGRRKGMGDDRSARGNRRVSATGTRGGLGNGGGAGIIAGTRTEAEARTVPRFLARVKAVESGTIVTRLVLGGKRILARKCCTCQASFPRRIQFVPRAQVHVRRDFTTLESFNASYLYTGV